MVPGRTKTGRNVATTEAVLEYLRMTRPDAALVLPSSAAIYGKAALLPNRISDDVAPISPYGVHKAKVEALCRAYGRDFGIRSTIIRFFSVYGIGLRKQLLWDGCVTLSSGDAGLLCGARFGAPAAKPRLAR